MAVKGERIELHASPDEKALVKRAAALTHRSISEFVINSAVKAARRAVEEHEELALSRQDSEAFVQALLSPPKSNEGLSTAAQRYKRATNL
ncbi:MAG: DUF1778 domain-containing protein [Candidatus Bipolaricaulota bacterium]